MDNKFKVLVERLAGSSGGEKETSLVDLHGLVSRATSKHNFDASAVMETPLLKLLLTALHAEDAVTCAHARRQQLMCLEILAGDDKEEYGLLYWPSSRASLLSIALGPECLAFEQLAKLLRTLAEAPGEHQSEGGNVLAAVARVITRLLLRPDGQYSAYCVSAENVVLSLSTGALPGLLSALAAYLTGSLVDVTANTGPVVGVRGSVRRTSISGAVRMPQGPAGKQARTTSQRLRERQHRQQAAAVTVLRSVMQAVGFACQALLPEQLASTGVQDKVLAPAVDVLAGLTQRLEAAEATRAAEAAEAAVAAAAAAAAKAAAALKGTTSADHGTVSVRLGYVAEGGEVEGGLSRGLKVVTAPPAASVSALLVCGVDGLFNCMEARSDAHADMGRQQLLLARLLSMPNSPLLQLARALSASLEAQEREQAAAGPDGPAAERYALAQAHAAAGYAHSTSGKTRGKLYGVRQALAPYTVLFHLQHLCQTVEADPAAGGSGCSVGLLDELEDELGDLGTFAVRAVLMPTLRSRGQLHQAVATADALEDLYRHLPPAGQAAMVGVLAEAAAQPAAPLGLVVAVAAAAGAITVGQQHAAAAAAGGGAGAEHVAGKSGTSGPRMKKQPLPASSPSFHATATAVMAASSLLAHQPTQHQRDRASAGSTSASASAGDSAHSAGGVASPQRGSAATADEPSGGGGGGLIGSLPAGLMVGRMRELAAQHAAGGMFHSVRRREGGPGHPPVGLVEAVLVGLAEELQSFLSAAAELLPAGEGAGGGDGRTLRGGDSGGGEEEDDSEASSGHVQELVGLVYRCTQRFQERLPLVLQHLQAHLQASEPAASGHEGQESQESADAAAAAAAAAPAPQGQDLLVSTACVAATRVLEACTSQLGSYGQGAGPSSPTAAAAAASDAAANADQAAAALRILATILRSAQAPLPARAQAAAAAVAALKKLLLSEWSASPAGGVASPSGAGLLGERKSAVPAASGGIAAIAALATAASAPAPAAAAAGTAAGAATTATGAAAAGTAATGAAAAIAAPQHPLLSHDTTEAAQVCLDALFGVLADPRVIAADPDLFEDEVCAALAVPLSELSTPANPLASTLDLKHSLVVAARALKVLVKSIPHGLLTSGHETLLRCFVNAHDDGLKHSPFNLDLLFAEGVMAAMLKRLHDAGGGGGGGGGADTALEEETLQFFASLTDWVPACRHRLRDLGLLKRVIRRMEHPSCGGFELVLLVSICKGMSESESLHTFMKEMGVARALAAKLVADDDTAASASDALLPVGSPGGLDALLTLANLNGGTASPDDILCQEVVARHDISGLIAQFAAEAVASEKGLATHTFPDGTWSIYDLPSLLTSCQSLTRTAVNSERLAQHALLPTLLAVLRNSHAAMAAAAAAKAAAAPAAPAAGGEQAAPAAPKPAAASGAAAIDTVFDDPLLAVLAARTLFNMAQVTGIHSQLRETGVLELFKACLKSDDLRVVDAARATLLQLGELTDTAVARALKASCAEVSAEVVGLSGAPADAAGAAGAAADAAAGAAGAASAAGRVDDGVYYDVFLSHKRTDARDFARALWNLLVSNGYTVFLDFEYKQELGSLGDVVGRCATFLFIMTDNVFKSEWCIKELKAAVQHNVNIVLLIKDGARWPDLEGNPVCDFPPPHLLRTLPPEVQPVFTRKPVVHNDEYYRAFVDALFEKLQVYRPPTTSAMEPSPMGADFPPPPELMDPAAAAAAAAAGLVPPHSAHASHGPHSAHASAHGSHSAHGMPHSGHPGHHGPHSAHSAHSAHAMHGHPHHGPSSAHSGYGMHHPGHHGLVSGHNHGGHHIHSGHHHHHAGPHSAGMHHSMHPGSGHGHMFSADAHAAAMAAAAAALAAAGHGSLHHAASGLPYGMHHNPYTMIANPFPPAATAAHAAAILNAAIHRNGHHSEHSADGRHSAHGHHGGGDGAGGGDAAGGQQPGDAHGSAAQQHGDGAGGHAAAGPDGQHAQGGNGGEHSAADIAAAQHALAGLPYHHAAAGGSDPAAALAMAAVEAASGKTHGALTELQAVLGSARRDLISEVAGLGRSVLSGQAELRTAVGAEVAASARQVSSEVRSLVLDSQSQVHGLRQEVADLRAEMAASRQVAAEMRGMLAQLLEGMSSLMQRNVQLESMFLGGGGASSGGGSAHHAHAAALLSHHPHQSHHGHTSVPLGPPAGGANGSMNGHSSSGGDNNSGKLLGPPPMPFATASGANTPRRGRQSSAIGYLPVSSSDIVLGIDGSENSAAVAAAFQRPAVSLNGMDPAGAGISPRLVPVTLSLPGAAPTTTVPQPPSGGARELDSPRGARRVYLSQPMVGKDPQAVEVSGSGGSFSNGHGASPPPLAGSQSANGYANGAANGIANGVLSNGVVLPPIAAAAVAHQHQAQHPGPPPAAASGGSASGAAAAPAGVLGGGFMMRVAGQAAPSHARKSKA